MTPTLIFDPKQRLYSATATPLPAPTGVRAARWRHYDSIPDSVTIPFAMRLFAMQNLTLQYVDTVTGFCVEKRIGGTKPLVRAVREQRLGIDRLYAGSFKAFAFPLRHADSDGTPCPCLGWVIDHPGMGRLLFATDTMAIAHDFPGIDHAMIEANYSDPLLDNAIAEGITDPSQKSRLLASHLALHQTAAILRRPGFAALHQTVLLHLSSRNSNPEQFRNTIEQATGKPAYVARPGLKVTFSKDPY